MVGYNTVEIGEIEYGKMTARVQGPKVDDADAWTNRLVRGVKDRDLPGWAKDMRAKGYARTLVVVAYLKWDAERTNRMVYQ